MKISEIIPRARRFAGNSVLGSLLISAALASASVPALVHAQTHYPAPTQWSGIYDPAVLLSLNVRLSATDLATIRADETFDIEVPALFWVDNVDPSPGEWNAVIRRKSATPIGDKISYRLKLESRVGGGSSRWNNVRSFSLENGDDQDVVSEGLAWFLHRRAAGPDYQPGLAAWTRLTLHVVAEDGSVAVQPQGVYLNVELPDKRFLQNRGLWTSSSTSWLYKQDDIGLPELKEWPNDSAGTATDSPAYTTLTYSPFREPVVLRKRIQNPTPSDPTLLSELDYWINMNSLLTLGAVNAFTANPDELFNHGKNFFWADFGASSADHSPRLYFPWDLDAAIRDPRGSIYGTISGTGRKTSLKQHPYQSIILNHPVFRTRYNAIMTGLLDGAFDQTAIDDFISQSQSLLTDALLADPNNKIGQTPEAIAEHFDKLRSWMVARRTSVRAQVDSNGPPAPRQ